MRTIKVKNVGPIQEAFLVLKKLNILIGPQSTGKSTLAKLACYCSWVEKEICLNQSSEKFESEGYFEENLVTFHKLNGFITSNSFIEFRSDFVIFKYENNSFHFEWGEKRTEYKRVKTLYLPAERNIVAVITNWFEVSFENNNTRSFLADWERVRKNYTQKDSLEILDLGKYFFDINSKTDYILIGNSINVPIANASSGLQSITPLQTLFHFYSEAYYKNDIWKKEDTIKYMERIKDVSQKLFDYIKNIIPSESNDPIWEKVYQYNDKNKTDHSFEEITDKKNDNVLIALFRYVNDLLTPNSTAFFIEEPELNLYPAAQRLLMNQMVKSINKADHSLFITTHSPYLLTSLNNLMYAADIGKYLEEDVNNIIPKETWVNKSDVGAWKIDAKTSVLHDLIDTETSILKVEELDDVSNIINGEFDELFNLS